MSNFISASLTTADKNNIKANINTIKAIVTFLKNLTPKDRQKLYKMGQKSEGFVKGVLTVLQNHPAAAPAAFNVSEFEKDYQLYSDLREVWMELIPLTEGIEDTLLLLSSELMNQGTSGYKYIKQAASGTMALDNVAAELGIRFKRPKKTLPTAHSLAANETITLQHVVTKRLFKTLNGCTVTLYRGAVAQGKGKTIAGNSKFFLPSNWGTLTVVNNHATAQAVFSVIQNTVVE